MKAGTTSLHHYLDAHPEITMTKPKEVHYFSRVYEEHDDEWYLSHFADMETPVRGETSPSYTRYPNLPSVPERMYGLVPNAKLVYVVRNPIDRIISHYNHGQLGGNEEKGVNQALQSAPQAYLSPSKYYMQLSQYLQYYSFDDMKIASSEKLRNDTRSAVQDVYDFLGVDSDFSSPTFETQMHKTNKRKQKSAFDKFILSTLNGRQWLKPILPQKVMDVYQLLTGDQEKIATRDDLKPETIEILKNALSQDVNKLRELTGRDFEDWDI